MKYFLRDGLPFDYATGVKDTRGFSFWFDGQPISLYYTSGPAGESGQHAYPCADISLGTWTEAPLYPKISGLVSDTTDWISSASNPTNDTCEVLLTGISTPINYSGHIVKYTYQKEENNAIQIDLTISLYQGGSLIAETTETDIPYGWITGSFTLTTGEAANITDYSNLRIRLKANTG